jgi:hypothetical protein
MEPNRKKGGYRGSGRARLKSGSVRRAVATILRANSRARSRASDSFRNARRIDLLVLGFGVMNAMTATAVQEKQK